MAHEIGNYNWDLLPKLASEVEHARRREALCDLKELLAILARDCGPDLTLRKMRCAQVMSACIRGARRGGGASGILMQDHLKFLQKLSQLRTWGGACAAMRRGIAKLVDQVEPSRRRRPERLVREILRDLSNSLGEPRTLAQYARELDLSTGHLSRLFKSVAGRPFRDELRRLRSEAAMALLRETSLKVAAIAGRVGLRSASQFIADFKRQTGVTPAQFRHASVPNKRR